MAKKWTGISARVTEEELKALTDEAKRRGVTLNALLYALIHTATDNFSNFACVPAEFPRGFVVRVSRKGEKVNA